jgi:hypothetical protein
MKRDMDLARQILRAVEDSPEADGTQWIEVDLEGRSPQEISYHVLLLAEADLLDAKRISDSLSGGRDVAPTRLTWQGHEFLDAARKDTIWEKAKSIATEKTGSLTFEALKLALARLIHDALG